MGEERKIILTTGKLGMIDIEEAMWRKVGFSEERIKELRKSYEKNCPEGTYYMDAFGWEYLGNYVGKEQGKENKEIEETTQEIPAGVIEGII